MHAYHLTRTAALVDDLCLPPHLARQHFLMNANQIAATRPQLKTISQACRTQQIMRQSLTKRAEALVDGLCLLESLSSGPTFLHPLTASKVNQIQNTRHLYTWCRRLLGYML